MQLANRYVWSSEKSELQSVEEALRLHLWFHSEPELKEVAYILQTAFKLNELKV